MTKKFPSHRKEGQSIQARKVDLSQELYSCDAVGIQSVISSWVDKATL